MNVLNTNTRKSIEKAWETGDIISSDRLNKIQEAITSIANYVDAPGGVNSNTQLATEAYVINCINTQLANDTTFGANLGVTGILYANNLNCGHYQLNGTDFSITSNTLNVQSGFPAIDIELPIASTTSMGGVIVGNNLSVDANGIVSIPVATTAVLGVMKPAENGNINITNGDISVNIASSSVLGLVKIGNNINVNNGTISVPVSSSSVTGLMTPTQHDKLAGIAAGAQVNVQSNWSETNTASMTYIQNKPSLGNVAEKDVDTTINPHTSSINVPTSQAVANFIYNQNYLTEHQNIDHKLDIPDTTGLTAGEYTIKLTLDNEGYHYSWVPFPTLEQEPGSNGGE